MHNVPILLFSPFWHFLQYPRSGCVTTGRIYPFSIFTQHSEFLGLFTAQIRRKLLQILGLNAVFLLPEEVTPHMMQAQAMRSLGYPGEGQQLTPLLWSWTTFTTEHMQLRANSWRNLDPEMINERDIRCRHLAEKTLWLKKPSPFWRAAFCPSATAGEFVWAQRDSSVGSLIGFPILQPREIKNWDEGVERQDELLYCTLEYLKDTFDKYNLTKT